MTRRCSAPACSAPRRLYLDYHYPAEQPELPQGRRALAEAGSTLLTYARQGFPGGQQIDPDRFEAATEETTAGLAAGTGTVLFDAAFQHESLQVRSDVVIKTGDDIDLFEVKSGTKVKPRHVRDVAFQGHGHRGVRPHRRDSQRAARQWPLQALRRRRLPGPQAVKHVDITAKVRRVLPQVQELVASFERALGSDETLQLPTGTYCHRPFPCAYLSRCLAEGPDHPLVELPELDRELETALHLEGVETLDQLDPARPGLSPTQQRRPDQPREDRLIVEDVVNTELADLDFPLHFVECFATLDVLPSAPVRALGTGHPSPGANDGCTKTATSNKPSSCATARLPRAKGFVEGLAETLHGEGTLICYGHDIEERLRSLLDELPEHKSSVRALLNRPILEFDKLIRAGVYHPGLHGDFSLDRVAVALGADPMPEDFELQSTSDAAAAFERLLAPRTRATTRKKVTEQIAALGHWRTEAMIRVYRALQSG